MHEIGARGEMGARVRPTCARSGRKCDGILADVMGGPLGSSLPASSAIGLFLRRRAGAAACSWRARIQVKRRREWH